MIGNVPKPMRWIAMLLVGALLAAACSSTNTTSSRARDRGGDGTEVADDLLEEGEDGADGSVSGGRGASTGSRSRSRATTGGGSGGGGTSGGGGGSGGAPTGPKVTGGTVQIGIHLSNNGPAADQFGVDRLPVSGRREVEAVVNWINANGGMGGKTVEPIFHVSDPTSASFDALAESACRAFTEDNNAFAVVDDALVPSRNMVACLAKHQTPLIWTYEIVLKPDFMQQYADYLYMPQAIQWTRLGAHIDHLVSQGFFEGGTIGLVRYDHPTHEAYVKDVFAPALARHGLKIASEGRVSEPRSAGDAGQTTAESGNVVLQFRQQGVNRVIFVPTGAALPLLFLAAAESQGFRPRYGFTSFDPPGFLADNHGSGQLNGSVATGWLVTGDLPLSVDHTKYVPAAKRCDEAVKDGGFQSGAPIVAYCESLFLLKDALDRHPEFTVGGLRAGIEGFGTSFADPRTFASKLIPGRRDGAAAIRTLLYSSGCGCYEYHGGNIPVP